MIWAFVFAWLATLIIAFLLGGKYGDAWLQRELAAERELKKQIIADRNAARTLVAQAKAHAIKAGIDVKKLFPFLALLAAIGGLISSCGGGTLCHAQTAPPTIQWMQGTAYSPETDLEQYDALELRYASRTVDLAAFSLTDQVIADTLLARARAGVTVRIYLDRGELQSECRGDITCAKIPLRELIGVPGISIRVKYSKVLMHLKSYLVDGALVRDGSANFSEQGERRQDNSATWSIDRTEVAVFARKFQAMWDRPDNLTVAQAVSPATAKGP